jgi:hypothetical protein
MARSSRNGRSSAISRTALHKRLRAELARQLDTIGYLICARDDCPVPNKLIVPGMPWDLGHKDGTLEYAGPEHRSCNRRTMTHARQRAGVARTVPRAPAERDTRPLADIPVSERVAAGRWSRDWY